MDEIQKTISTLINGGIAIFPTDTAYGIGCRIDREDAIKRLFEIRKRPETKPMLALVSSIKMAEDYLQPISAEVSQKLIEKYWPGGLTIIYPCKRDKVPAVVRANGASLGVRLPDQTTMEYIISKVGVPIVAPSANFSGEETPYTFDNVNPELIKQVDYALKGECTLEGQSTVIDCTKEPWEIIRSGVVDVIM